MTSRGLNALVPAGLLLAGSTCFQASAAVAAPVSFRNEVMAVLSKAGCNTGPCHGNRNGKGGFKLSLRGEDPEADYAALVHAVGGRRVNIINPEESLLLLKPTTTVPHEGQLRLERDSTEYEMLRRWIADRAPDDRERAARPTRLDVSPATEVLYAPKDRVQLKVIARFQDGSKRDVTALACYEAVNTLVDVSRGGLVTRKGPGETTVLVRYLDRQAPVSLAFVPETPYFNRGARPAENNFIDRHVFAKLRTLRLNASPLCADEVFCRRAFLDLLGLLPTADEARGFVADRRGDKRARLVDTLLERPEFAEFWALKWMDLLRADERALDAKGIRAFHQWIRAGIATNKPLDQFARELIAARGSTYTEPAANFYRALRTPVERAESAAQVFLGTRLQCAQCHNHPYERWTQDDYHDWTGVFARVSYKVLENRRRDNNDSHEFIGEQIVFLTNQLSHTNPRLGKPATPRFLGEKDAVAAPRQGRAGVSPALAAQRPKGDAPSALGRRDAYLTLAARGEREPIVEADELQRLSSWLTSPQNPRFARAQVNRIWFHLMGRGLVDPVDDFRATNPASHPQLLDALTADFVKHKFDLRHVIRLVMNSRTYQLSSTPAPGSEEDAVNYSHVRVRRLGAEQLLDCESQASGVPLEFKGWPVGTRAAQVPTVRVEAAGNKRRPGQADLFLRAFGKPPRQLTTECERSCEPAMGQAFQLISGPTTQEFLGEPDNRLGALLGSGKSDREMLEELFWTVLTRAPEKAELERFSALLAAGDKRAALEDILWALLNAKEFVLRR
ncbi:MAG TPA: DUF1549 and DUF1553 domain-containing protein [Verrucomicrobiae bacterium]|nr:DUF1549 and DUF1553 domain-containing protein [Verrucomicrobiae bacterium]